MLQKLGTFILASFLVIGCDMKQQAVVEKQKEKIAAEVDLGDDIFAAKEKLVAAGFRIKYGPDFPTKTKRYLMLIVDYGESPSKLETFKYTVGLEGSDKPITGVIKATPEGKITSIE